MARLPRLSIPGLVHYLLQRGHNGGAIVHDSDDAERLLEVLRDAALSHGVVLHAYALMAAELHVLATPDTDAGVSRMMQSLGRRYSALFNRRHRRSGALWDSRFRSAVLEPGVPTLLALRHVDALLPVPAEAGPAAGGVPAPVRSSASQRLGGRRDAALVDPAVYWQLGNTPFDRELGYRRLLAEPVAPAERLALERALQGGGALGSTAFLQGLAHAQGRPLLPRARGRPRRLPASA